VQPIVWLPTREVVGFEALSRFSRWTPDRWFHRAWTSGEGLDMELAAVESALPLIATLPDDLYLAINVSPLTLLSARLEELVAAHARKVVLELTEHDRIGDYSLYRSAIDRLRSVGARFAVDDAGAGHSSLQHILELAPDMIKLDRSLTTHCNEDPAKRSLMVCLATFASQTKTCLIAEGIETSDEAEALVSYGVAFGQGYYFGRPAPELALEVDAETGGWVVQPA
jgi:EAL domain-containing protein (putative c-di-GMP-specific phosphodiesterase class I)